MLRETSLEVYKKILANNTISKMRDLVLRFVAENPCCTMHDCMDAHDPRSQSSIGTRFSELERMGLIELIKDANNNPIYKVQNGNNAQTYQLTGVTKIKPLEKKATPRQQLAEVLPILYNIKTAFTLEEAQKFAATALTKITL